MKARCRCCFAMGVSTLTGADKWMRSSLHRRARIASRGHKDLAVTERRRWQPSLPRSSALLPELWLQPEDPQTWLRSAPVRGNMPPPDAGLGLRHLCHSRWRLRFLHHKDNGRPLPPTRPSIAHQHGARTSAHLLLSARTSPPARNDALL